MEKKWIVLDDGNSDQALSCMKQLDTEKSACLLILHEKSLRSEVKEFLEEHHMEYRCETIAGYEKEDVIRLISHITVSVSGLIYQHFTPVKASVSQIDRQKFQDNYQKNIRYPFFLIQKLADIMTDEAHIILVGSIHAEKPTGEYSLYSMAMGAVKNMVKELALQLGVRGITANFIEAGVLNEKPLSENSAMTTFYEGYLYKIPSGKTGNDMDIAGLCAFLMSEAGSYINGAEIRVDGGMTLHNVDAVANHRGIQRQKDAGNAKGGSQPCLN